MSTESPDVSVVMSVYNAERFLPEAVESVLAQTGCNFELVVVDDGSTDSSAQILNRHASIDPRMVVHSQANQGRAAALNHGFGVARAPFVARLDADDAALPSRLERQWRFLVEHERVAVVGGGVTFMDGSGRPFADWQYPLTDAEIRKAFVHTTPLVHPAVMVRKDAFLRVGGYRPLFLEAEDVDLWLRIAEKHELANLPEIVIRYRVHPGQATVRGLELQTLGSLAARVGARERAKGGADPLDTADGIDHATLVTMGATEGEITSAHVRDMTWLAKTMDRAGYANAAKALFVDAAARARSESGSPALVAHVHRVRAGRYAEQRRRARATLETVRARRAESRGRRLNAGEDQAVG